MHRVRCFYFTKCRCNQLIHYFFIPKNPDNCPSSYSKLTGTGLINFLEIVTTYCFPNVATFTGQPYFLNPVENIGY